MIHDDPGWKPAFKGFWKLFVSPLGRSKSTIVADLSQLRSMYLALVVAQFLYLVVVLVVPGSRPAVIPPGIAAGAAAIAGIGSISLVRSMGRRALDAHDARRLAASYRGLFFLRFANAEFPMMVGFGGYFLAGHHLWVFLVGWISAVSGLIMMAPTRVQIQGREKRLLEENSTLSLIDSLQGKNEKE